MPEITINNEHFQVDEDEWDEVRLQLPELFPYRVDTIDFHTTDGRFCQAIITPRIALTARH
jgi:V8-like Glu-specific endopeptidase